jgi:hypothetical protein
MMTVSWEDYPATSSLRRVVDLDDSLDDVLAGGVVNRNPPGVEVEVNDLRGS